MEEIKKLKIKFSVVGYLTLSCVNFITHTGNGIYDSIKASEFYPLSKESKQLMNHQRESFLESEKLWLLVPGSVAWRWVDRPNLKNVPLQEIESKDFLNKYI